MEEVRRPSDDRSLGDLLRELMEEVTTLIRQEANLAKTEMSQKAAKVGKHLGFLAAGGAIAYAGLLAIVAAVIIMLAQAGMAWWAAALLVGVVVAGLGGFLVMQGISALKNEDLVPRETIEALKEDRYGVTVRDRAARPG
jgi:uncharacterized membrane protein YqjE